MKGVAILKLLICYCTLSFSQPTLTFSRMFESVGRNIPMAIINSRPDFFYLLRYNKVVHDFTIECRAKPTAEIKGFTALKLDDINASWFNYEKLDYLFFEQDKSLYFLFEKVTNTKKTIYLKIVDSLHQSSKFSELATLSIEKGILDIDFEFKTTFDNNILIVGSQTYYNSVRKTAMLFNIQKRKMEWSKKLAIENEHTGYSTAFECNNANDLFCIMISSHVASYERKYLHHMQLQIPVVFCDNLTLVSYLHQDPDKIHVKQLRSNMNKLNSVKISVLNDDVIVQSHYAIEEEDSRDKKVFFSTTRTTKDLSRSIYDTTTILNETVKRQLTFYDGTDSKYAGDKQYSLLRTRGNNNFNYQVSERKDEPYYKELIVTRTDLTTGTVLDQHVVFRKNSGASMSVFFNDDLYIFTREAPSNFKKPVTETKYNKFRKENVFSSTNIVMYCITKQGNIGKKLVTSNSTLIMTPLRYDGDDQDHIIFYQEIKGFERFATLTLNPS